MAQSQALIKGLIGRSAWGPKGSGVRAAETGALGPLDARMGMPHIKGAQAIA
jgi:hypothetical protein